MSGMWLLARGTGYKIWLVQKQTWGKFGHVSVVRVGKAGCGCAGVRAELSARTITLVPPPGRYWPRLSP